MLHDNKFTSMSTNNEFGKDSLPRQETQVLSKFKKNIYKKYSPLELKECVIDWVIQKRKTGMRSYCSKRKIPRKTLCNYLKEMSLLIDIRDTGGHSRQTVEAIYDDYMQKKQDKQTVGNSTRGKFLHGQ